MSILLTALALAGAAPAAHPAPGTPAAAPATAPAKKECCCAKMDRPMACCDKHGDKPASEGQSDPHAGHDMGAQ